CAKRDYTRLAYPGKRRTARDERVCVVQRFALPCRPSEPRAAYEMRFRTALCTVLCAAACAALPAVAALYKWTDENGRVVYGDTPPPGAKAERISVAAPPADPNAVRDMASKDAELKKRAQARADEETKAEKAAADDKARLDRCVQIRG